MIRGLGLAGIDCALVGELDDYVRSSRFVKVSLDRADPTADPERLLATLCEFARSCTAKPVLYFSTDADLLFVSRYRDKLSSHFHFAIADADHVEKLLNKEKFRQLAETLKLPVPLSQTVSPASQPPSAMKLPFPIILKPAEREVVLEPGSKSIRDLVGTDVKCVGVSDRAELERIWEKLARTNVDFIAQELIPGPESRIESYHAYIDATGNLVASFTGRKIRTYRAEFGYSTGLETTDAPDVGKLGQQIVDALGLHGVVKVDLKRRPDDSLALLEINPRFSLWQHLGAKAGVNFLQLVHADLTDEPRGHIGLAKPGIRYCRMRDFRAAREQGLAISNWLSWMLRADAKEFALDDPMPLFRRAQLKLFEVIQSRVTRGLTGKRTA
ncbi:MAG: ATP-grasp domain-containing protein [Hyphomicrobiaceae bacterium]|nr:ATP-grasp domain-containing protein [Hyphomicrobiaceae bacterium]